MKKTKKQIIIGFDLDGVIIDNSQNKINFAKKLGFKIKKEDTPSFRLKNKIDKKLYPRLQNYIYTKGTKESQPAKNVKKALGLLKKKGVKFYIISRRQPGLSRKEAKKWLKDHLAEFFNKDNIFFVKSDKEKEKIAKKLNVKIFLDDNISVLRHLESVPYKFLFLPFTLKKRETAIKEKIKEYKIKQVFSWNDFLKKVSKLKF